MNIDENSCRVCLINTDSSDKDEKWFSLEEKQIEDDLTICDKITICTGLIINPQNFLAKRICKPCNENLRFAFDFRKNCITSNSVLNEFIKKHYKTDESISSIGLNVLKTESSYGIENNDNKNIEMENFYPEVKVEVNCSDGEETKPINDQMQLHFKGIQKKFSKKKNILPNDLAIRRRSRLLSNKKIERQNNFQNILLKNSENDQIINKQKQEEKESYICELCGNVYKKKALLSDHMRWHSGQKEFQCEICEKTFLLATYLARHMKTHTGIRNFQCSFCSRTFYTNGLKRAHEKVHTGERQYPCKLCDRSFSYSQSLQRHMMVHSGVKPFKCKECGKEFRQETHLKQHLSTNIHQAKTAAALLNN